MFGDKSSTFSIACFVLAVVMVSGCSTTLENKAFTYKDPVADSDIHVDIYNPDKAWNGTTLLADNHRQDRSRIIEVNMQGRIVWEYPIPGYLKEYTNPGFDVERLPNNNILYVLPLKGVYEINRSGDMPGDEVLVAACVHEACISQVTQCLRRHKQRGRRENRRQSPAESATHGRSQHAAHSTEV